MLTCLGISIKLPLGGGVHVDYGSNGVEGAINPASIAGLPEFSALLWRNVFGVE